MSSIEEIGDNATLTRRELEVLELVAIGYTNPVISEKLSISENTTRNHLHKLYLKLNANNRVQLVLIALKSGLYQALLSAEYLDKRCDH